MISSTGASLVSRSPRSEPADTTLRGGRLVGRVEPVARLSDAERDALYGLLARYFDGATRSQFERDLAEKEWALLLADADSGQIRGFSTLMRLPVDVTGQRALAFFSGDTIVDRGYWGESTLARLWIRKVLAVAAETPGLPAYWFLISSGYRTYRFLPTFFRAFYPGVAGPTPAPIRAILDAVATAKYPDEYDPQAGIVRLAGATPLRAGVGDITARELRDPHVAFFAAANPGHARGDELACLASLAIENLTPAGRRMAGLA